MDQVKIEKFREIIESKGFKLQENIYLKPYTSLLIGGKARLLSEPHSIEEIRTLITNAKSLKIPYYIIGNGSNILVSDSGVDALAIITKTNFNNIRQVDDTIIIAQAGIALGDVCQFAYEAELTGLEFAWGIPASVGGAVFMNAGAYGGETKDVLLSCTYVDEEGNIETLSNEELNFSYRHSYFSGKKVCILEASFELISGEQPEIKAKMDDLLERRKSKQPLEYPSAGSTFKRPKGNYASALIEQSGLKGYKHGNAMVSDKHAGFVINHNNASSAEFLHLIEDIKRIVKEKTGYELECEIRILGED